MISVKQHLSERVEWKSYDEILEMVVADKENYTKPSFFKDGFGFK